MTPFSSLSQWLDWQQSLHPSEIDLGLERISKVLQRLVVWPATMPVIAVGGTNGKGSTLTMLDSVYSATGYKTGRFTSPHLLRYNERICIDGQPVSDEVLCQAFNEINEKRGDISLTYFEFSALAAWLIFIQQQVDVALMEVGLGGRLDAVNALNPSLAVITTVAIDHTEWLGQDREAIGREKAGIFREGCPAVCGDPEPPQSLLRYAEEAGAELYVQDRDFALTELPGDVYRWEFHPGNALASSTDLTCSVDYSLAVHQQQNLSTVFMAISCMQQTLPVKLETLACVPTGLSCLQGRGEVIQSRPEVIVDVAHNAESVAALASRLGQTTHNRRTLAVFSALFEKNIVEILQKIHCRVDAWYIAPLLTHRAMPIDTLQAALAPLSGAIQVCDEIWQAFQLARKDASKGDRIIVFGSFYTVAAVLDGLKSE